MGQDTNRCCCESPPNTSNMDLISNVFSQLEQLERLGNYSEMSQLSIFSQSIDYLKAIRSDWDHKFRFKTWI